ncbi:hypothetical protein ACXNZO_006022 [Pseudomonas aeruginosa]
MSKELNKAPVEQAEPASCQGTNCGTTTGDHSSECLAEAAASQGWELKPGDLCGRDCPMRPDPVEQAGGDERAVDGKPRATKCPDCGEGDLMPGDLCACGYETDPAAGYACSECDGSGDGYVGEVCRECDGSGWFVTPEQARAALAQPSPAPVCTTPTGENCPGDGVKSCKKCPEQAEGERPKVVARVVHSNPFVLGQCGPLNANDELMTVAQHAASVARWAEMFNRVEQERDAALARVAELEQKSAGSWTVDTSCGRPILMYEGCSVIEDQTAYEVIRMIKWIGELERQEPVATVAKVPGEDWNSLDLHCNLQDIPPGTKLYAAPVAQAQHSLPEGWMLVECGIWTQEQVDEMQKTVTRFRNSEFVDDRALAMAVADAGQCKAPEISLAELLAAAPGKEGV